MTYINYNITGRQLFLNDTKFNNYIDRGVIDTTIYQDVTQTFIQTYNLEFGFYNSSQSYSGKTTLNNPNGQTATFIQRFVAIDFVPKSAGEFIVVLPDTYITTCRYLSINVTTWQGVNSTTGSVRGDDLLNGVNFHSHRIIQLNPDVRTDKWAFQCGVPNGSTISIDTLIANGFKVYKKN